jgi:hypothetical protein
VLPCDGPHFVARCVRSTEVEAPLAENRAKVRGACSLRTSFDELVAQMAREDYRRRDCKSTARWLQWSDSSDKVIKAAVLGANRMMICLALDPNDPYRGQGCE